MATGDSSTSQNPETLVYCHMEDGKSIQRILLRVSPDQVTLKDLKEYFSKQNFQFTFNFDDKAFGEIVQVKISDDNERLPLVKGRVECWLKPSGESPDRLRVAQIDRSDSVMRNSVLDEGTLRAIQGMSIISHSPESMMITHLLEENKKLHEKLEEGTKEMYEKLIKHTKENAMLEGELREVKTELMKYRGFLIPRAVMERFENERCPKKQRNRQDRQQIWYEFYENYPDLRKKLEESMDKEKIEEWKGKSEAERKEDCGQLGEELYNLFSTCVHMYEPGEVCLLKKRFLKRKQIAFMEAVCDTIHVKCEVVEDEDDD